MISKFSLNNIATFTQKVEIEPTEINYFYGSNGTGKTTISKVIANESAFPDCCLLWQTNPIETLVYNKDFVKSHFSQSSSIKGIFTLGKDATEAKEFIEKTKKEVDEHASKLEGLRKSLNAKQDEERTLTSEIIENMKIISGKLIQVLSVAKSLFFRNANKNEIILQLF